MLSFLLPFFGKGCQPYQDVLCITTFFQKDWQPAKTI
jgi:hypothetical protein